MAMYTFNVCNPYGLALSLEAFELPHDGGAFAKAGQLLEEHLSCDRIEIWDGDRAVLARHREQPVIRPVDLGDRLARSAPAFLNQRLPTG